jgi:hypothetical protein
MGRTTVRWMLQLHTHIISHQSEAKQNKTKRNTKTWISQYWRSLCEYQFCEGKVSLNRRGRNQSKRCSAIDIPHCFLLATEKNAFPERWIRRRAARGNLFGRTDMIHLLLLRIAQSFSNNVTICTSEESRFDSRQEKQNYFFSNGTRIFPWGAVEEET